MNQTKTMIARVAETPHRGGDGVKTTPRAGTGPRDGQFVTVRGRGRGRGQGTIIRGHPRRVMVPRSGGDRYESPSPRPCPSPGGCFFAVPAPVRGFGGPRFPNPRRISTKLGTENNIQLSKETSPRMDTCNTYVCTAISTGS